MINKISFYLYKYTLFILLVLILQNYQIYTLIYKISFILFLIIILVYNNI